MKCPNCGNLIELFRCRECGFDIKKSRLISAVKYDAFEISSMNEYVKTENEKIENEERRRAQKAKEDADRKKAEEAEAFRDRITEENRRQREQKEAEDSWNCYVLASIMRSGDDYSISQPVDERDILITLNGAKKIEDLLKIENINDPEKEQIVKRIREAICRKEQEQAVRELIDAIGEVKYDDNCRKKIRAARIAFSNLDVAQRMSVSTDKLSKAESEYAALRNRAEHSKKTKRTILTVCAVLALCIIGFVGFIMVSNHNKSTALTENFIALAKQGDEFLLGKYEQDNNLKNGQEDIEWIVIGNENGIITAISKYCIEDMPFNDASIDTPTDWSGSTIREWLNTDFYESAFSDDEKRMIKLSHLSNPGNSLFNVDGGEDTDDYVFLVGKEVIESYYADYKFGAAEFSGNDVDSIVKVGMSDQTEYEPLKAQYTEYAKHKYIEAEPRVDYDSVEKEYGKNSCFWWTRVTGDAAYSMFQIINSGGAMSVPAKANCGIRPVICIETENYSNQQQNEQHNDLSTGNDDASIGGGWGDSDNGRPSYTIDQINSGELGDIITFNSISDGKIGDEKNFVAAKVSGAYVEYWNANSIDVKDGETYTIRLYVHNNNPNGHDAVARDVSASFSLPTDVSTEQTVIGYIDSSNAKPMRYWDGVTLVSDNPFYIEYVDGSAKFYNTEFSGKELSNEIITSGVQIGYESLNGRIPGCYKYDGVVTVDVMVHSVYKTDEEKDDIQKQFETSELGESGSNPDQERTDGGSTKSIHYYCQDVSILDNGVIKTNGEAIESGVLDYYVHFGPGRAVVGDLEDAKNCELQLNQVSKEFYTRLNRDPILTVACLGYVDKELGTRLTGKFYSDISTDWVSNLNEIVEEFINDQSLWNDKVMEFEKLLDTSTKTIEEASGYQIKTLYMGQGEQHPIFLGTRDERTMEGMDVATNYFVTYSIPINDSTYKKVTFLLSDGFAPVFECNKY